MKYLFSICTLFLLCTFSMVQAQITVLGVVLDSSNGLPLPNFTVRIDQTPNIFSGTATTDATGAFQYTIPQNIAPDLTIAWEDCSNPGDSLFANYGYFFAGDTLSTVIICDSVVNANFPNCTADFFYTQSFGTTLTFFEQAAGNNLVYSWDFGDGTTGTGSFSHHTYASGGTYTVCLSIADSLGNCADSICQQVVVAFPSGQTCNADFLIGPVYDDTVSFQNVSNPGPTGSLTYQWLFGDGASSNAQDPTHVYPGPGSYNACLIIDNDSTGCTDTLCQTVVIPSNCSITFSSSGGIDSVAFFASIPSSGNSSEFYLWDFGDGTVDSTNNDYVSHTYANTGDYLVCLTYINLANGCFSSYCDSVTITQVSGCSFDFAPNQLDTFTYEFVPAISGATSNVTYWWSFGDGNSSTQVSPTHTYASTGFYNVCLTLTDTVNPGGCSGVYCYPITVSVPSCPTAEFDFLIDPFALDSVFFFEQATGSNLVYQWDLGDGTTSAQPNVVHIYNVTGPVNVCLTVTDTVLNCTDSICKTVNILPSNACSPNFVYNDLGNSTYDFFAIGSGNASTQYDWEFGDGTTASGPFVQKTYTNPGTYLACLTVTDSLGSCIQQSCQTIVVNTTPTCNALFHLSQGSGLNQIIFTAQYVDTNALYTWNFGDGTVLNTNSPSITHTYSSAGFYTACLGINTGSCSDSSCVVFNTTPGPNNFGVIGQVFANGQIVDDYTAWLIVYDSVAGTLTAVDTFQSDPTLGGLFIFGAPNGDYRVKVAPNPSDPNYSSFLPTYYGDDAFWFNATVVNQSSFPFLIINLEPGNNSGGPGFVGGLVSQGANKNGPGDPMMNTSILVMDMNDQMVAAGMTNDAGEYSIGNLAYGTYKVQVEMWGRNSEHYVVDITANNETFNQLDFEVTDTDVLKVGSLASSNDPLTTLAFNLYPNPAKDQITVQMEIPQANEYTLRIRNMMGQSVWIAEGMQQTGLMKKEISLQDLPSGVYHIDIIAGEERIAAQKFHIIR
ncbi:MAG: PKD domain-containing protein [Bacteroidota bacterium]